MNPELLKRLETIETLWRSSNNTELYSFDGFINDRSDIDWMIQTIRAQAKALELAKTALELTFVAADRTKEEIEAIMKEIK